MKGYRFYLQHESTYAKRQGRHLGRVIAIHQDATDDQGRTMCFRSRDPIPNAHIQWTAIDDKPGLRRYCKRISEEKAREIHPRMFEAMDGIA